MKSIRANTFETNSSSVHSLTLVSASTYKKWETGEAIMAGEGNLVPFADLYSTIEAYVRNRVERYEKELAEEKTEKAKEYKKEWLKEAEEDLAKILSVERDQFLNLSKEIILKDAGGKFDETYYDDYYYVDEDGKLPECSEDIVDWGIKKPIADILINYCCEGYITEEKYYENDYYETYRQEETIDGVDVVAFGYYGHD